MKIYLAGPDVFRKNARAHFKMLKSLAEKYGHVAIAPLDNDIIMEKGEEFTPAHAMKIFHSNVKMMDECDVIIANIEPFRGACIDDGTAFELGYGYARDKMMYGYSPCVKELIPEITSRMFDLSRQKEYSIIENFGSPVNLMLSCAVMEREGKLFQTFEECLLHLNTFLKIKG
jgi:nucleoside 2-deoxyribosyltransferase